MSAEFKTGDLVWAKMKGFPYWPGQVTPPVDYLKTAPKKGMLCIFFFGTNNYAWMDIVGLKSYAEFKESYSKQSKLPSFKKAVKQIEDYVTHESLKVRGDPQQVKTLNEEIEKDAAIIQAATLEVTKNLKRTSLTRSNNLAGKKRKLSSEDKDKGLELIMNENENEEGEPSKNGEENHPPAAVVQPISKRGGTARRMVKKVVSKVKSKLRPTKKKFHMKPAVKAKAKAKVEKAAPQLNEALPPNWESPPTSKTSSPAPIMKVSVPKSSSSLRRDSHTIAEERFMDNYFKTLSYGYNSLLAVFQHLKMQDLLSAGRVCTMWRDLANHPSLWRIVRMRNSQLRSFQGLAAALNRNSTHTLDLRKVDFIPLDEQGLYADNWQSFSEQIIKVDTLRTVIFCSCPTTVVERLAKTNQMMEAIYAQLLVGDTLCVDTFDNLTKLTTLSLKSASGFALKGNLSALRQMNSLKHMSLTSVTGLNSVNLQPIADLSGLETLELGDCTDLPLVFCSDVLIKLTKLKKLRLEKGQGDCHTCEILSTVQSMPHVYQLELVNFDIKSGFDKAIGACKDIKKLLLIPTYISQSATTDHLILSGVIRLRKTLTYFLWGVTLELLRVTDLFVVQTDEASVRQKGAECIPILKPVPTKAWVSDETPMPDPPQVDVLALPALQKHLIENLPNTRVKILKIPFHATWRQNIRESS